jgi:hypothetical protein
MATSLEEMLTSVPRPALAEQNRTVTSDSRNFPVRRTRRSDGAKWIFNSKATNCVGSNRIPKLLAGRNWHAKERTTSQ